MTDNDEYGIDTTFMATLEDVEVEFDEGLVTYHFSIPYDQTPFLLAINLLAERPAVRLFYYFKGEQAESNMGPAEFSKVYLAVKKDYVLIFKTSLFDMAIGIEELRQFVASSFFLHVRQLSRGERAEVTQRYFKRAKARKQREEATV